MKAKRLLSKSNRLSCVDSFSVLLCYMQGFREEESPCQGCAGDQGGVRCVAGNVLVISLRAGGVVSYKG